MFCDDTIDIRVIDDEMLENAAKINT